MACENEIAIVGIGCNFPGGEGIDCFWKVLENGRNCTTEISPERFNIRAWSDPDDNNPGKMGARYAALLDECTAFDNKLFGINDEETKQMDPQQKLLLECTYRALEDAGITTENISGTKTGVFVGDCEAAVCGAANCIMEPWKLVSLCTEKSLSPEKISEPSSGKADDCGRGEGCGVLLLKPLIKGKDQSLLLNKYLLKEIDALKIMYDIKHSSHYSPKQAQEEFNKIWGVITSSAVNQNGRSGTTDIRPSQQGQEKLLLSIYPLRVDPSTVQYIEVHGTSTPAGDLIETESIGNVIGKKRSPNLPPLKIGSVKGNIGHTGSAAGAAGIIKVLLMMHHGKFVPSLHYSESTSSINTEDLNLSIPTTVEKWDESHEFGRVAGINCFASEGNNAHIVVRQVKQTHVNPPNKRPAELFVISAASSNSLKLAMEDTARHIDTRNSALLPNLAYTSACRRSHRNHEYRKAFVTSSLPHLEQQLLSAAETETVPLKKPPQFIFVFSSNESDFKGICKNLLRSEPVFRNKCNEIKQLFQQISPSGIWELTEKEHVDLSNPEIAQPLLFTVQVALVTLLQYWGIKPIAAVGHSVGEAAAAHCAGLLSLEDAVKVVHHRSRLQAKVSGGKMLVVGNIPVEEVSAALSAYSGKVCVAAFNSPQSCTLSGDEESISAAQKHLAENFKKRNIFLHLLNVPVAYHSHMMDPILTEMAESISVLKKGKLIMDLISTATGKAALGDDFVTGFYWAKQAQDPVSFAEAIMTSAKDKGNIAFVVIGPQRAFERYITEALGAQTRVFHSMQIDRQYVVLLNLIKDFFELGLNIDWHNFYDSYQSVPSVYPRYQFDHQKFMSYWNMNQQVSNRAVSSSHPLIYSANEENSELICCISDTLTPYLYEHKNHSVALIPSAFFVELGLAAVLTTARPKVPLSFCQLSITFIEPCTLTGISQVLKIKVESQQRMSEFRILSGSADTLCVSGQVTKCPETSIEEKNISLKSILQRCISLVSKDNVYESLAQSQFHCGSTFRQLNDIFYCEDLKEAITTIKVKGKTVEEMHEYYIHPVLLDAFLQMAGILAIINSKKKVVFPSCICSLTIAKSLEEEMMIYLKTTKSTDDYLQFCGCFTDKHGSVLAELKCVQITFVKEIPKTENVLLFENNWTEITSDQPMQNLPKAPRVVVFADKSGIAQQLKNYLHSESRFVAYQEWDRMLVPKKANTNAQINLELQGYQDVVFMWGMKKLNESVPEKVVKYSVRCCEAFRQVVIALRKKKSQCSITIITYRTSEGKVDHINTGFVLYGMTRTCMAEAPDITFQIIDISSTSPIDISALADVLVKYKAQEYPEVWIDEGRIYASEIRRTQIETTAFNTPSHPLQSSELCILYTADPYNINDLTAQVTNSCSQLGNHSIEVQIEKVSLHSEDYFPISVSSCKFGEMLYWNSHTVDKHQLLALDFTGTVTAAGIEVRKLKVGDHIVSCYPVPSASRINIPGTVCFNTQKFPFFRNIPCMSFFYLAWEVLCKILPVPKYSEMLGIISTEPDSVLCQVLIFSAQELGWKTISTNDATGLWQRVNQCNALIFLPPLNRIFKEALTCLFHLRDVVLVYGNEQPECLRYLIGSDQESICIHIVNLIHTFQKASLIRSQKEIYCWLKSMNMKQLKHLPHSSFQQPGMSEKSDTAVSYFNCKSVPVVVLTSEDDSKISDIPVVETERRLFKQNAAYIVTGGLSGLGLQTVKFIAQNGGGRIVILSRRNPSPEIQNEINDIQDQCEWSRIVSLQCNVIFSSEVEKAVKSISKIFPNCPIKGVFHSAVVLHDGHLETLTMSHFEKVLNPKVAGAINLHCAMQGRELDHFVCYTSFSSFLGNATQSNYAAANSFLELFCHYRRNSGLAGQSINWGALNLGTNQNNMLQIQGLEALQVNDIHKYLKRSLILNNPQQAVVKLNFQTLANHVLFQNLSLKHRFNNFVSEELCSNLGSDVTQNPFQEGPVDYTISLLKRLCDPVAVDLSLHTPLSSLGIDSALASTLQNRIFMERRVEIPLGKLLDPHSTVSTLILYLKESSSTTDSDGSKDADVGSWL
ncbi:Phthioceranic/hydroxyphthioceranic acid synthase [Varanus komodoensis]|nr:Phthioceranic/hydroxyphthioceranic acid synthase [Varanus komodoensis]